jgi:glycine cleavage system aminomethyltransferase T
MARLVNIGKDNFIGKAALQAIRDNGTSQIMKGIYFET